MSNLSDKQKNMLKSQMTKDEVNEYRKLANDLMEKRFNLVKRNKYILDYLLLNPEKVKYEVLKNKYNDIDLSITVYTIKSIINVMGESDFSKDDGSSYYNKNSDRYYDICKKYWCRIWWDTDTGVLSKEDIEKQRFSEYHKNCNKISTIAEIRKYLDNLKIKDFHQKYRLDYLIQRYKLDKR